MNPLDQKLYALLGDKTLSFGCLIDEGEFSGKSIFIGHNPDGKHFSYLFLKEGIPFTRSDFSRYRIIGHEPTIADLHKWVMEKIGKMESIRGLPPYDSIAFGAEYEPIKYDSSKSLLSQSDETKQAIIDFVTSNS